MPSRSLAQRVREMLEQIAETQQLVEGMSVTEFREDRPFNNSQPDLFGNQPNRVANRKIETNELMLIENVKIY